MRFHLYAPVSFEPWDHRNPDGVGIGGSETAVVETARILAQRGHEVAVYAPLADGCPEYDRGGARWLPLKDADFTRPGIWVLHRAPAALDHFPERKYRERGHHCDRCDNGCMVDHDEQGYALPCRDCGRGDQQTWLVCQDVFYPHVLNDGTVVKDGLTPERSARLDWCLPLCRAHEKFLLTKSPELAGKMRLSSNGVRLDLIDQLAPMETYESSYCNWKQRPKTGIVRDPYRIVYTSSPDRGLPALLKIFKRAREFEPRLNLTAAYGWDNIKKCEGRFWLNVRKECDDLMNQPGVTWAGRLKQPELYRLFLSAGLWVYPTTFTETSCVTCMEAQALGAVPITNPWWALADNVKYGTLLQGDPSGEPLTRAQYVGEILRLTRDLDLQERIRREMMPWAREQFAWEKVVDQYEAWATASLVTREAVLV